MSEQPRRRRRQGIEADSIGCLVEEKMSAIDGIVESLRETNAETIHASQWQPYSKEEFLQYLKDAIDQESAIIEQETILTDYINFSVERKPRLVELDLPADYVPVGSTGVGGCYVIILSLGGVSFGIIFEAWWLIILSIVVIILCFMVIGEKMDEDHELNERECNRIEIKKKTILEENERRKNIYSANLLEWETSKQEMVNYMTAPIQQARTILNGFYSNDIIYPKYRTLPALTSIYEYFITGRCEELTGPHGAYNMYEDEMRKDTVISQLNKVIENLEQIKQNQYMLYEQVCAIQQNTAAIRSELAQIKGHTIQIAELSALNAYYAKRNERNTRILMYYHL